MKTESDFPFKAGDRVWVYCRDSGGITQDESVAQQRYETAEICRRYGVTVAHFFADEIKVGSTMAGREALDDLLSLAKQAPRPVDGIIFWSMARLARNQLEAQFIKGELRTRGYIIYSMIDDIPPGEFAPIIEALIDWKNERFLKDLSNESQRGLRNTARKGYAPGGFPPRGYLAQAEQIGTRRDGSPHVVSRWVPDPELGPRVTRAFEMRSVYTPYREIHETTHVMGTIGSYVTMFRNKTYLGIRKCGDLEIENAHEPLVSRELWDAVQATLRERPKKGEQWPKGKRHSMRANSPYLLSGIAVCAICGAAMVGGKDNVSGGRQSPWPFYLCGRKKREGWHACPSGKIGAREPEEAVLQAVTRRVLTPDFLIALVAQVNMLVDRESPLLQAQISEAKRQIADVDKAIRALLKLAEQYETASVGPRLVQRETEQALLQERMQNLVLRYEESRIVVSPEMVHDGLMGMGEDAARVLQAQRVLLSKVVKRVELSVTGARLFYTFPLPE